MITASIVIYNSPRDEIEKVLGSLEKSSVQEVYVIDHSESDILREVVEQYGKAIYEKHPNGGYGSGHNHGIKKAIDRNSTYHAVINPDIYFESDVIGALGKFMDTHPDCGLVMPQILFPNGEIQYLCKLLPTPMDLIGRRFIPLKGYTERHNHQYEMRWTGYDKIMEVPCLSGCFMFMRTEILKETGGFDERFFLYAEDFDMVRRISQQSRTMFTPEVSVYHECHRKSYKSLKYLLIHINSVIKYFNKWGWIKDNFRTERNRECISGIQNRKKGNQG